MNQEKYFVTGTRFYSMSSFAGLFSAKVSLFWQLYNFKS